MSGVAGSRTMRFRQLLSVIVVFVLASCGSGAPKPVPSAPDGSGFQSSLAALGISLDLPPGRAVLVNIPSYELVALEDGVPVFWSRVIIGKPETRTPRIDTAATSVVFRPSWKPTPEMVASGEVPDRIFPPGPENPMGLLAVTLDARADIAMHDTNQRYLFSRERRAFSHGCIRVERWDTLAAWLLGRDVEWVREMAEGTATRRVDIERVPVLIRYFTVFPTEDGGVREYPDIYGLGRMSRAFMAFQQGKDADGGCSAIE